MNFDLLLSLPFWAHRPSNSDKLSGEKSWAEAVTGSRQCRTDITVQTLEKVCGRMFALMLSCVVVICKPTCSHDNRVLQSRTSFMLVGV